MPNYPFEIRHFGVAKTEKNNILNTFLKDNGTRP